MWLQQVYLRTKKCTIWWRLIQKKCMLVNRLRTRQLSCRLLNCHFLFAFTYVLIPIAKFIIIHIKIAYSMTQLSSHTFAHVTVSSFKLKAKLLPNKNVLHLSKFNQEWPSFSKIKCFKDLRCRKMSITKNVLLNFYPSLKKRIERSG